MEYVNKFVKIVFFLKKKKLNNSFFNKLHWISFTYEITKNLSLIKI